MVECSRMDSATTGLSRIDNGGTKRGNNDNAVMKYYLA